MYKCICVQVYMCTSVYVYKCICVQVNMCTSVYVYICICVQVYTNDMWYMTSICHLYDVAKC